MNDRPEWFAAKRYGYGAGLPISWQGWLVTILFMAVSVGTGILFAEKPLIIVSVLVPLVLTFLLITAKTTRGGWQWRWGKRD